ncbi:hypothetical protein F5X68DRAFT_275653 [Plectosphaerella plurivora]|uniref:Uncharacterized protein n=1 Tax=Plectosphaerella plurivora TaxID=936078 RepID=A0A9P8VCW3_9PEZI|nr:hypothetical protein F5X68DRAFT_275653 [Plectosphaerella plurivora]
MNAGTPPPLGPTINTSGYNYVLQFIAAVREEEAARIADAKKAVEVGAPRLRASIHAKQQEFDAKRQELAKIEREMEEIGKEIEGEEAQVQKLFSDLETLKAQDPLKEIHNRSSVSTGLGQLEHDDAPQNPNQSVLDDGEPLDLRPNKRRRTADDNSEKLTERTVDYDTVYANGQPTHHIVEYPKKSGTYYIVECQKHALQFNKRPLLSAMKHAQARAHGAPNGQEPAIKELGSQVIGCDAAKFKQNNEAFKPKDVPKTRPRLSEVVHPEPGKLYLGPWVTRGSKTWYAVVVLPLGDLQSIGMEGTLRDTGLLKRNIPRCYKVEQGRIVGFRTGYDDHCVALPSRKYPLLWIQANVHFNFRDGKLQIPKQQCFSWLPANKLRTFHGSGPDGKPIEIPAAVRDLFQPPGPNQAPLADMEGAEGVTVADDESDEDHVDEPGQRSDDEEDEEHDNSDDDEEKGDEEENDADDVNDKARGMEPRESGGATAGVGSVGTTSIPNDASTQSVQSPGTMSMQSAKNQPLHAQTTQAQPHRPFQPPQTQTQQAQPTPVQPSPGQLRQSPKSMYPSPVSRTGSLSQHPRAPTVPSLPSHTTMPPPSNLIATNSQPGPASLRNMAAEAMAHKSLTNHHHSFQPQLGEADMMKYIQESGQSVQKALAHYHAAPFHPQVSQGQAEMAPMGPVQYPGMAYPGPNQMMQPHSAGSRPSEEATVPPWRTSGEGNKRLADGKPAF